MLYKPWILIYLLISFYYQPLYSATGNFLIQLPGEKSRLTEKDNSYTIREDSLVFRNGDRVCFVGNSITNNGFFHEFIRLYYLAHFPHDTISFFNCGISGDDAGNVLNRMDDDILSKAPTWSVVKLGMNDVRRSLYSVEKREQPGIELERQQALDIYKKDLEEIIVRLIKAGSKVILQKPTIYDQTALMKSPNFPGVNDALERCCVYIDQLAAKYRLPVVNYWEILNTINTKIQKKDPHATIIGPDRVHPQVPGHFIMFYQFINKVFAQKPPTEIRLNAGNLKTSCNDCEISEFKQQDKVFEFIINNQVLPFPVPPDAVAALEFVPFQHQFNRQLLIITDLKKGNYQLYIDEMDAGVFSKKRIKKGIDLSQIKSSPLYGQSEKLMSLLEEYRKQEAHIRSLKLVEYTFLKDKKNEDVDSVRVFLDELLKSKYAESQYLQFYKEKFEHYFEYKPKENDLRNSLNTITNRLYEQAAPNKHTYRLVYLK